MTELRVVLVDDEQEGLNVLEYDLSRLEEKVQIIKKFRDPKKAVVEIPGLRPDIVFLDIEMPWMNGFEMLDKFDEITFDVIFVTAYDQFAIKAFRYYAIDYLLKPVELADLKDAIQRVKEKQDTFSKSRLTMLIDKLDRHEEPFTKIAIPTVEGLEFIVIGDIVRCEANNNYCFVYLSNGKRHMLSKPLKYLQELLKDNPKFYRTHQSHLINIDHIARFVRSSGGYVVMSDDAIVNISRTKKEEFIRVITSR